MNSPKNNSINLTKAMPYNSPQITQQKKAINQRYTSSLVERFMSKKNANASQLQLGYTPKSTFASRGPVDKIAATRFSNKMPTRGMRGLVRGVSGGLGNIGKNVMMHGVLKPMISAKTMVGVGMLGMTAAAFTRGAINGMQDSIIGRYLRDQRNTSALSFGSTRVGLTGSRARTSIGNHVGLSLSMSKTRHGGM